MEVLRKPFGVPTNGSGERTSLNAIERRKVRIQKHFLPAQKQNRPLDPLGWDGRPSAIFRCHGRPS